MLWVVFFLGFAYSYSLKRTAQKSLVFAEEATQCQVTDDSLFKSQSSCPGAVKSSCQICGPSSVTVTPGGQVSYNIYLLSCDLGSWSSSASWGGSYGVIANGSYTDDDSISWIVEAQTDAFVGDSSASTLAEWCIGDTNQYVGIQTQINVARATMAPAPTTSAPTTVAPTTAPTTVAPTTAPATFAPTSTLAPTTTPTPQQCPTGYSSYPSISAPSPRDASWCGQPTSSCNVCVKATGTSGVGASGKVQANYLYSVVLACSLSSYASAYISWNDLAGATTNYVWLPENAGTNWTIVVQTTEGTDNPDITFMNEWCLSGPGISGYAGYQASIPWPQ